MKKRLLLGVFSALGILVLILDARTAVQGAAEGVDLCVRVLIPSLFPFFILSVLLTDTLLALSCRLLTPLGYTLGIPKGAEALIAVGLLGGYPIGAQAVTQSYRSGTLDLENARRMLGFCSNAGPAFLFGIVAAQFSDPTAGWKLWLIQILSAGIVGILLPQTISKPSAIRKTTTITVPKALEQSVRSMANVCGWVILFRVLIRFIEHWFLWIIPETIQVILALILELSNGCLLLDQIVDPGIRFLCACGSLSFGGICVIMQTASVTQAIGLGQYLPGKLIQTVFSLILGAILWYIPRYSILFFGVIVSVVFLFSKKRKIIVENSEHLMYNLNR